MRCPQRISKDAASPLMLAASPISFGIVFGEADPPFV
jgi:hypothetical protein